MGSSRGVLSQVRPGERRALGYFFLLLLLVGAGLAIGRGIANTLFLKRFGIEYLPWVYVTQGVALACASVVYATVSDRIRPERILGVILKTMVALLCVFWILTLTRWESWAYPQLYLLQEIASEILVLHITLYVGSHFDGEQSKRLMPMAMAGGQLGELVGGLLLAGGARVLGARDMLLVYALFGVAAWFLVHAWHARYGATRLETGFRRGGSPWTQAMHQLTQGIGFARESDLLRNSLLAVFFSVISLIVLSYLIKGVFVREFPREEDLAAVFGMVTFVGGSIAFLAQLSVTGRLIDRFGVRGINLAFPVSTLLALVAFLTPWSLMAAMVGTFNRRVMLPAIRNPSRNVLWQALPDYMQGRARGLLLAIVAPAAMLVAGVLVKALEAQQAGMVGLGIAIAMLSLYYARCSNLAYMDAIMATLKTRLFVPRDGVQAISPHRDDRFFAELVVGLNEEDEILAEGFARMLIEHFGPKAVPAILQRLDRAGHPCKDRLTRLVAPYASEEHAAAWLTRLERCDPHGQASILGVAFLARWPEAMAHVRECLSSANPRLVACGILGCLSYDDAEMRAEGERRLQGMLRADDIAQRVAAMEIVAILPQSGFRSLIWKTLEQPHARLRTHALRALEALAQPVVEPQAPELLATIYREAPDWELRAICVRVSGRLPLPLRIHSLILALDDPQPQVQRIAGELLAAHEPGSVVGPLLDAMREWRLGVRGQAAALHVLAEKLPLQQLGELAMAYLDRACQYNSWLAGVDGNSDNGALLAAVLAERTSQLGDLGLRALALGPDRVTVELVRAAFASNDRRQRMRCLDLLEDFPDHDARERIRRLLHPRAGVAGSSMQGDIVAALIGGSDRWLADVARQGVSA